MLRLRCLFIAIFFFALSCTTSSPFLEPAKEGKVPEGKEYITVYARPVYTSGWFSEDNKKLGIDLSSYFTAFDVKIVNKTERTISLDKSKVELIDSTKAAYSALSETDGIEYYKSGGLDPNNTMVVLSKSRKLAQEDMEKIRKIIFPDNVNIDKGGERDGIILFKKLKEESCKGITLKIAGITVEGSERGKEFEFKFVCPNK